jgi:hypothetical protein
LSVRPGESRAILNTSLDRRAVGSLIRQVESFITKNAVALPVVFCLNTVTSDSIGHDLDELVIFSNATTPSLESEI